MTPEDFELVEETLARFDPETRYYAVEAMRAVQGMPLPVFGRLMADLALQSQLRALPPLRMITGA